MRCIALAEALQDGGDAVVFAMAELPPALQRRVRATGASIERLRTEVGSADDALLTERLIRRCQADAVVIDGYRLGQGYAARLRGRSIRLVVDDLGRHGGEAEIILDQNLYATLARNLNEHSTAELLIGPAYALLRREFTKPAVRSSEPLDARRILVSMGGGDPVNATELAVAAIAALRTPQLEVRVLLGAARANPTPVERAAAAHGFQFVRDATSVADQMAWADLVVGGCGTTVLEVARTGRPFVGLILAENQVAVSRAVSRHGLGVVAGWATELSGAELAAAIRDVLEDQASRTEMAARGPVLVDGLGARRVASVLRTGPLLVRTALSDDAPILFDWANDPTVRSASFHSEAIGWSEHLAWLNAQLASPDSTLFVCELAGVPVGLARFVSNGDAATISVLVDATHRARGVGTRLISRATQQLVVDKRVRSIDAFVKPDNHQSIGAFQRAGYLAAVRAPGDEAPPGALRFTFSPNAMG